MSFEANQGQTDARVKFLSRGSGYTLFLTQEGAVLSLHGKDMTRALRMKLLGANRQAAIAGADTLPGKSNYFIGNDPKQWRTNVPTYGAVRYSGVYPGIDLVYHGNQRLLEYDFVVAAGADPSAIDLRFDGARKLSVNADGALVIAMGSDEVIEHAPVVYQNIGGERKAVDGRYVLRGNGRVSFSVAPYDRNRPLVIDPTLSYATFLGGTGDENGSAIAVDGSRNAYVVGTTTSINFPTTHGAFQTVVGANGAGFVTKLNADGTALIYSTYLGGSQTSSINSVAVDALGNAYVAGVTQASDLPTTPGAYETTYPSASNVGFMTKLNATGTALVYSTFMDGGASSIGIDGPGNAYVLSTTAGYLSTLKKLNASGSSLVYSDPLESSDPFGDHPLTGSGIAVDVSGNVYVTGSGDNLNIADGFQGCEWVGHLAYYPYAFVVKFGNPGYSRCLGGPYGGSSGVSVAADASGNAYVTGLANASSGFGNCNPGCAFIAKINSLGSQQVYGTAIPGTEFDSTPTSIAVDALGDAFVTGPGYSSMPFFALDPNGGPAQYVVYGGSPLGQPEAITVDRWGSVYLTGSANWGTGTTGSFQPNFGGGASDAFVNKSPGAQFIGPATTASVAGWLGYNGWYRGAVTVTLSAGVLGDSKVAATYYSVDSGPYQTYSGPFSIAGDGVRQYQFYSVDTAGNKEKPNQGRVSIDATPPVSRVAPLPAIAPSQYISVQWSASDPTSGVAFTCQSFQQNYCVDQNYGGNIYVSVDNGPFSRWLSHEYSTQAWYVGQFGHTYAFYSIYEDMAGNVDSKWTADAVTTVPAQLSAYDLNGDGYIDCADVAIVKASFGKKAGQAGFDPRADVNHDGVVDVRDLAAVTQKLIPGTRCQ